jgi:broad specificity phosphatase PhoE
VGGAHVPGHSRARPQALAARERDKWAFVPPGGESYAQVALRMREWYDALPGDTVVVAHGGTARALIGVLGIAPPTQAPSFESVRQRQHEPLRLNRPTAPGAI